MPPLTPRRSFLVLFALALAAPAAAQSWTFGRFNIPEVTWASGIAYGKGRFVAGVQGGGQGAWLAWSADGNTWTQTALLPGSSSMTFFADAFYNPAGLGVYRSSDGATWQQIYQNPPGSSIQRAATNGRGMMIDPGRRNGVLVYSPDMATWTSTAPLPNSGIPGAETSITALAAGAGRYFVSYLITNGGAANGGYTASSVDGQAWTLIADFFNARFMAGGNGRFVAIWGSFAYVSTDGTRFTRNVLPADLGGIGVPGSTGSSAGITQLVFAGGRFVAIPSMHASLDGAAWSVLAPFRPTATTTINGLAYGNGRYVVVGVDISVGANNGVDVLATLPAAAPPLISTQPAGSTQAEGGRALFSVAIENADIGTTYQWRRDGVAIAGATNPSYSVLPVTAAGAGRYTVDVRNAVGLTSSEPAQLVVVPATQAGRIINLSVLTALDSPASLLSAGYVVGGAGTSGTKALLLRAGGPSLTRFGVANPHADPRLELYTGTTRDAENDNWSGLAAVSDVGARVGAFPFLSADSRDAAIYAAAMPRGDHTVRVSGGGTGTVIAEIYDATPPEEITAVTPRLINVSVLKALAGGDTITAGFVIGGSTAKTVLVRAVGPALAGLGVAGAMADPRLAVYRQGSATPMATNDNWDGEADTQAAMAAVGAFALPTATSKDAALVLTLAPGSYTAQVSADAAGGYALVEVYDVP